MAVVSAANTVPDLETDLDLPRVEPDTKAEFVVPRIIHEPEGEDNMATNLRAGFRERQCKCLSEYIAVTTPPTKRSCTEAPYEALVQDTLSVAMPPTDVARPSNASTAKSSARENTYPIRDGASTDPAPIDDDLDKKEAMAAPHALS